MNVQIPSYQLTRHPIGSLGEIWALAWPLMLGLLSGSVMLFADRLLLARYSTAALNAGVTAGIAAFSVLIIPLIIAGISEVLVGRQHGAGKISESGKPAWQMIWFSLGIFPLSWLAVHILPHFLFQETGNEALETTYFQWCLYFAPAFCSTIALTGFFVGIGRVQCVTWCAILGNVLNVGLDILFINGWGFIPEMGVKGAALATGISQVAQTLLLGFLFLRCDMRQAYGTANCSFDWSSFKEAIQIGAPVGVGRFLEIFAHVIFFRIVLMSGNENLIVVSIVQSFLLLFSFIVEGLSKGVSSIVANLVGGGQDQLIDKVLGAAIKLQAIFATIFFLAIAALAHSLLPWFFSSEEALLLQDPSFMDMTYHALLWMSVFFLFDGFGWVYVGFLTAVGDTKFMLYASLILNWIVYLVPVYLVLVIGNGTAVEGWMVIAFYGLLTFLTYRWRFLSKKWKSQIEHTTLSMDHALMPVQE